MINKAIAQKRINFAVFALAFVGIVALLFATGWWGIGVSLDSTHYIGAARNLLDGYGLSLLPCTGMAVPLTHYPPLYPVLLALIGVFGVDPLDGARWLGAFLFGANIFLAGFVLSRHLPGYIAALGALLMLVSFPMLQIHLMAWTEPLFILLGLWGFYLLAEYEERSQPLFLMVSAIVIGLAFLTRYVGITLVGTGVMGILLFSKKKYGRKIIDALIFGALSCLPIGLWLIRNSTVTGAPTDREMTFHPMNLSRVEEALSTFLGWLLPFNVSDIAKGIFLLVIIVGLLIFNNLSYRRGERHLNKIFGIYNTRMPYLLKLLAVFIFVYGIFLVISISFIEWGTPLDDRILSPMYVSIMILTLYLAYELWPTAKRLRLVFFAACSGLVITHLFQGIIFIVLSHSYGLGYTGKIWRSSETLEQVKALPAGIPIFSNGPQAICFLAHRPAEMLPAKVDAGTLQVNERYSSQLIALKEQLESKGGVVVYFDAAAWRWYLPTEAELKKELSLHALAKGVDGVIYEVDTSANK